MADQNFDYQATPQPTAIPQMPPKLVPPKRIPQPAGQRLGNILISYIFMYLGLYMYQENPTETAHWLPVGIGACFVVAAIWPTAKNSEFKKAK